MNNYKIAIIALVIIVLGVIGYKYLGLKNSQTVTPDTQMKKLPVIKMAVPPGGPIELIERAIVAQKLDSKYGFQLDVKVIQPQDFLLSVINKNVDAVYLGPTEIATFGQGKDLTMVYSGVRMFCPIMVRNDSKVTEITQLKGKKLGVLKKPSAPYSMLETVMKADNKPFDSYFKIVEGDLLALPVLLLKGDVDAVNFCNILSVAKMSAEGNVKLIDSTENRIKQVFGKDTEIPFLGLVVRKQWEKENLDLLKNYIKASNDVFVYLAGNTSYVTTKEVQDSFKMNQKEVDALKKIIDDNNYFVRPDWVKAKKSILDFISKSNIKLTDPPEEVYQILPD